MPRPHIIAGVFLLLAANAHAQDRRIDIEVDYVAGPNIYLSIGRDVGLAVGDTLYVEEPPARLRVISTSSRRTVVSSIDEPFAVVPGDVLIVVFTPHAVEAQADTTRAGPARPSLMGKPATDAGGRARERQPIVSGRVFWEMDLFRTTTEFGDTRRTRDFVNPSTGLRARVSQLPGNTRLDADVRYSYRYSSLRPISPDHLVRIYRMSIQKRLAHVPLRIEAGRFYSPYESYSGYWDGVIIHYEIGGFGIGVATGFQPVRSVEGFSTEYPKYSLVADYSYRRGNISYDADASFHHVSPQTGLHEHTFAGWSQRLRWKRLRLTQDVQIDRNPVTSTWIVTRMRLSGSIPVTSHLHANGRYAIRQPYLFWSRFDVISDRRDEVSAGLSYQQRGGTMYVNATSSRREEGGNRMSYSAGFAIPKTPVAGIGFFGNGSYYTYQEYRSVFVSSGLSRTLGPVRARASYQLYRYEQVAGVNTTHFVDGSLEFRLARRWTAQLRGRRQFGETLSATSVSANLWVSF